MPSPVSIPVQGRTYLTPVLNEEMNNVASQIQSKKEEITENNNRLIRSMTELKDLEKQFLSMYIQQQGSFPS